MPANTSPIFTLTPRAVTATIAAANSARDGSGTLGVTMIEVMTAGTNGSRVDFITFTSAQASVGASSAKVARVFITDTDGLNIRLISEVVMSAVTSSNTAIGATSTITYTNGLILASGQKILVAQSVFAGPQDQTHVLVRGGDY